MSNASKTVLTLVIGAAAGAVAALLLAPQSGKDTRKAISEGAKKAGDNVKDRFDKLTHKVKSTASSLENGDF